MIDTYPGLLNWGIYLWIGLSLALGIGITLIVRWLKEHNIRTTWYDWVSVLIGIALLAFTIQNFYGAFQENVPKAAFMFLLMTGVPSLILLALPALRIVLRKNKATV